MRGCVGLCEACIHGKQHRLPFPSSNKCAYHKLDLVHLDVCGSLLFSLGRKCYFVTFIDDYSCKIWLYLIHYKGKPFTKFCELNAQAELQSGCQLKVLCTNGGGEYTSFEFEGYLNNCGVIHEKTVSHTPEQNGLVEVVNRIIIEQLRCMLHDANLPTGFWAEAEITATYLTNWSPISQLPDMTPEEAWFKIKPNITPL